MKIKRFTVNPLEENCYILWDEETLHTAIIDCGIWFPDEETKFRTFIEDNHLKPILSLQTHMHFDHIWGLAYLHHLYGLQPSCHELELSVIEGQTEMTHQFGLHLPSDMPSIGKFLQKDEVLHLGETCIEVLYTPGHTPGGICFYVPNEKTIFSGDTLFCGSYGRTDFPGGSMDAMRQSLQSLFLLPNDTKVFPGHGPATSIGIEKQNNAILLT